MKNNHLINEDRLFAESWDRCTGAIQAVVEAERAHGPFAIATRKGMRSDAGAGPWQRGQYQPLGEAAPEPVGVRTRVGAPMNSYSIEDDLGVDADADAAALLASVRSLTRRLIKAERAELAKILQPAQPRPWTRQSIGIADLREPGNETTFDLIINTEVEGGVQLGAAKETLKDFLGGSVVAGMLGDGAAHLIVPSGAVTIFEAGRIRSHRPAAGRFRLETVLAVDLDPDAQVHALAPDPTDSSS